jgi:hypothetical protein
MMESGECGDKGAFMNVMAEIARQVGIHPMRKATRNLDWYPTPGAFSRSDAGK